jgi:hypothetical protein
MVFPQSEDIGTCIFLDITYKDTISLFNQQGVEVINRFEHNFENEDFISFEILNSNDSMFYVNAYYAIDGFITKGWIKKDNHLGIYSRAYNQPLKLYEYPCCDSEVQCIIEEYNPDIYIVTDCENGWLKVETIFHGRKYGGWLSPEMQCCNVYTTCN